MQEQEIIEGNKLIAEFMGYKEGFPHKIDRYGYEQTVEGYRIDYDDVAIEDLEFHSDWNWLMPVIRKIIGYCINESEKAFLSNEYTSILETIPLAIIEDSFKVVVEFIKWYNTNGKQD